METIKIKRRKNMYDLKCKRVGCVYNENCNCTANNVKVGKMTECETYKPSKKEINKESKEDKIVQPPTRKNIRVACDACCLFNDNCCCKANGISVMTNNQEPECCTFMPK